jgi:hypothetical protein
MPLSITVRLELVCSACAYNEVREFRPTEVELWRPREGLLVVAHSTSTFFRGWSPSESLALDLCPSCSEKEAQDATTTSTC